MDLTDRQKQVISVKRLLSNREKRAQIKEWDLEVWTEAAKHTKTSKVHIGAPAQTAGKGKRKEPTT